MDPTPRDAPDAPGEAPAEPQIPAVCLRAPIQVWAPSALVWAVFATIFIGIATSPLEGSAGTAVAVPLALLAALLTIARHRAMHIVVNDEGVTMQNFLRTHVVRWDQVEEVLVVGALMPYSRSVGVRLRGEQKFLRRLPWAQATNSGGQVAERERLLDVLRRHCDRHGIPCRLTLESHGTWWNDSPP